MLRHCIVSAKFPTDVLHGAKLAYLTGERPCCAVPSSRHNTSAERGGSPGRIPETAIIWAERPRCRPTFNWHSVLTSGPPSGELARVRFQQAFS
jgi:hypothetical protein